MSTRVVEPVEVTDMVTDLHRLAARFDPDSIQSHDVGGVITDLGQAKRLIEGMVTVMARRASDITPTSGRKADREAAELVARATGTSAGAAKRTLETSKRLADQPKVVDAIKGGRLSGEQANAVSDAAQADPDAQDDLLDAADQQSLSDLRQTCRDTKANADPAPDFTRERHRQRRSCRTWTESDGEWKAALSGPQDYGARFEAALRAEHDQMFRAAHAAGQHEPATAYRLDALMALLERGAGITDPTSSSDPQIPHTADSPGVHHGGEPDQAHRDTPVQCGDRQPATAPTAPHGSPVRRSGRETKVIVTVDAEALRRGLATAEETCHIAGIGRVSMTAIKRLIPDAHLAYVITGATDVTVAHLGRQATAHQRTALEARGYECEVPGCRAAHLLEIDHVKDWAFSRKTELDQLAWLCTPHHELKSRRGHRLSGPPGRRTWTTANGRILAQDPDPPDNAVDSHTHGREPDRLDAADQFTRHAPTISAARRQRLRAAHWTLLSRHQIGQTFRCGTLDIRPSARQGRLNLTD